MLRIAFVEAGDELCSIGPACDTGYDESPKVMPDSTISHRLVTTDVLVSQKLYIGSSSSLRGVIRARNGDAFWTKLRLKLR